MDKYTDLGNQGVTNTGENVRYIHTYMTDVMINVGSLRLTPKKAVQHNVVVGFPIAGHSCIINIIDMRTD